MGFVRPALYAFRCILSIHVSQRMSVLTDCRTEMLPLLQMRDPITGILEDCQDRCSRIPKPMGSTRELGQSCQKMVFHSTREEYTQFLRDRERGVLNDQQIRDRLVQKSTGGPTTETKLKCKESLYCASSSPPMIEELIVTQAYQFDTGA